MTSPDSAGRSGSGRSGRLLGRRLLGRRLLGRRLSLLLGASALALAATLLAVPVGRIDGSPRPGVALVAGSSDPVRAADATLRTELRSEDLSFQDVTCIKNGRVFRGHPIIRCNVNFGDPHVEAYCTVILAGRLVTNYQNPAIGCRPDPAGSKPLLFPAPSRRLRATARRPGNRRR